MGDRVCALRRIQAVTLGTFKGVAALVTAFLAPPARHGGPSRPDEPQVQEHGQDNDQGVDASDRSAGVDRPGPRKGGRRHEEEPEERPDEAIEGPSDVVGEDHEQDDDDAGRDQTEQAE